ncbi:YccS family putative transporter [Tatumella ptyseos]|uniref:YccS family putative transporter n=1 Tax=Tatumella ptyseos TaxID=82987 RepID=UPI0026EC1ED6|nr:YccS family putative transporter [Tatumella ptyseos]WKX27614.1 YccS family putative transporter [Tatumella ptyseos]
MMAGRNVLNKYWQHYILNHLWQEPVRIFVAMSCVALFAWYHHAVIWAIPLILGIVAAALTDIDDRLTGRLKNIVITLVCFSIATISVELLFPHPLLFLCGLGLSSWTFIMLGALGQRYATIAFGAILIAIYTMLGIGLFPKWYIQPLFLLAGAGVYYIFTLVHHLLFPARPVEAQLIKTYSSLARYLETKATLFDPDGTTHSERPLYKVSLANSQLVQQLNSVKTAIQSRLRGDRASSSSRRALLYYFVAQEIHERANSSHIDHFSLQNNWHFNELMFRCERLLRQQAMACREIAESIQAKQDYQHNRHFERALANADIALERILPFAEKETCERLRWLLKNLRAVDQQLASVESEQLSNTDWQKIDTELSFEGLRGWQDIKSRFKSHLSPKSVLFRHAVRVSLVLCTGYIFIQSIGLERGYWILLTSLFVCQPNYSATKRRLALRVIGTLAGILIGLPLLWLIPSLPGQLVAIVLFGVLFFLFRQVQYAQATLFITLMVLFCFNLLGEGFNVALPRIIDTLIGCGLAWLAVTFIFPDWHYRQFSAVISKAYRANARYLKAVTQQYKEGKDNRVSYRIARRDAHNADAELASVITSTENRMWPSSDAKEASFSILCTNHSLLSYIAALGSHRQRTYNPQLLELLFALSACAEDYEKFSDEEIQQTLNTLTTLANSIVIEDEPQKALIIQQVSLIINTLRELNKVKEPLLTF